jgi:hypothetical protein
VIVLDENLDEQRVRAPIKVWYKGKVISLRELRPGTVIKDDPVPARLCQRSGATFLTTNTTDFWRRISAHRSYCVVCVPFPTRRQDEIPNLLRRLLGQRHFRSARQRMGKIIRITCSEIRYYQVGQTETRIIQWT